MSKHCTAQLTTWCYCKTEETSYFGLLTPVLERIRKIFACEQTPPLLASTGRSGLMHHTYEYAPRLRVIPPYHPPSSSPAPSPSTQHISSFPVKLLPVQTAFITYISPVALYVRLAPPMRLAAPRWPPECGRKPPSAICRCILRLPPRK